MTWTEPDHILAQQEAAEGLPSPRTNGHRTPPSDDQTEAAVLGAALITTTALQAAVDAGLEAHHFYRPRHQHIWTALTATGAADRILVVAWLRDHQLLDDAGGEATLLQLMADAPGTARAGEHAARIVHLAQLRRIIGAANDLTAAAWTDDTTGITRALERLGDQQALDQVDGLDVETLAVFCDHEEPAYDWAITGLLEHGDRILLTGPEGGGKSTLIRQVAVQAAAGVHPFTLAPIEPLTVLLLDLENSRRHVTRALRPLRVAAGRQADLNLHVSVHPEGLGINDPGDARRLEELIARVQPDLVCGGPVYKLVDGDPIEEGPAKQAALTLDRLRTTHGFALLLETHQPHESGGSKRPERPYGASLWKRWPEFGLHLATAGALRHWRGARDERAWPSHLQRGGAWPWTVADVPPDPRGVTFDTYRLAIIDTLEQAGEELGQKRLEDTLAVSHPDLPRSSIRRAIDKLVEEQRISMRLGPRNSKLYSTSEPLL